MPKPVVMPKYNMKTDQELSKFLLGAIRDVRKGELEVDKAEVISKLADKYTKNEIMRCLKAKITKDASNLDLDSEINKQLMINAKTIDS